MATIVDIETTVDLLEREWSAVADMFAGVTEEQYALPTCLPGWSVKDQLAHMAGVEMMLDGVPTPEVDVSHLTHLRNDVASMGEVWVESMRPLPGLEVLERFVAITAARLAALRAMTQADFDAPSWTPAGPDETYGRFMRIRHYDTFLHEHDVRAALGLADRDEPGAVRFALDETEPALGYIVGRKAGMPPGSRVRIDLTGSVEATYLVEVGQRATVVESFGDDPTVGISLPTMLFFRLTGGRQDPTPHVGTDIALSGDTDLATRLATNLAYTI